MLENYPSRETRCNEWDVREFSSSIFFVDTYIWYHERKINKGILKYFVKGMPNKNYLQLNVFK